MEAASSETMLPPTATAAHIDTALKDNNKYVRRTAIKHPTATASHVDTALKDDNWNVRRAAQTAQEKLQK